MTRILLTGATGHAGSALAEFIVNSTDWTVVSLQRLPTARLDRLAHLPAYRIQKVYHDFRSPLSNQVLKQIGNVKYIVHNGALVPSAATVKENPQAFVDTNLVGTYNVLEAARVLGPEKFLYTSTGQVFGSWPTARNEDDRLAPPHPYAASKAAAELLVGSYHKCFGLPTIVTRVMNLFGERQQSSKFIAGTIARILRGEPVSLHVDIAGRPSEIQWMHVRAFASNVMELLEHAPVGETYHVPGVLRSTEEIIESFHNFLGREKKIVKIQVPYLERYLLKTKHDILPPRSVFKFALNLRLTAEWFSEHQEWL